MLLVLQTFGLVLSVLSSPCLSFRILFDTQLLNLLSSNTRGDLGPFEEHANKDFLFMIECIGLVIEILT